MKNIYIFAAVIAATVLSTIAQDSTFVAGNYYGSRIDAISYVGWGAPGLYQEVVDMSNGQCKFRNVTYSGGMAPLDREISLHFRGPVHLKQFAFYSPAVQSTRRSHRSSLGEKRHRHAHQHNDRRKRTPEVITATIDGQVVSWTTSLDTPLATTATSTSTTSSQISSTPTPSPGKTPETANSPIYGWSRQAYYNAENAHGDGLVFLNNHGGAGSGVFDYDFGLSLSYASSDGTTAAASPEILGNDLLSDAVEVSIWTDQKCSDTDCGYYRPGSVTYHGFNGAVKLFLIEFDMPMGADLTPPNNMPAIWALNANIARTQQYGSCSCWPGCGEWDLFEVLDPGNFRMSSSVESDLSGRDIDWFERPTNETMKAAVLFDGPNSTGHVHVLPDNTDFSTSLPETFWSGVGKNAYDRLAHGSPDAGNGDGYLSKVYSLANHASS